MNRRVAIAALACMLTLTGCASNKSSLSELNRQSYAVLGTTAQPELGIYGADNANSAAIGAGLIGLAIGRCEENVAGDCKTQTYASVLSPDIKRPKQTSTLAINVGDPHDPT